MSNDPFAGPSDIPSEHPSAASFRGRLVLIEPTNLERGLPNALNPGQLQDRLTATVTTVDGAGPVVIWADGSPTNYKAAGPRHEGVWFSQDRIIKGCLDSEGRPLKMILARLETFKPGEKPKKGNPWGLVKVSEADKQTARDFLANRTISQASAPADGDSEQSPF
jgi:hypothetical protein